MASPILRLDDQRLASDLARRLRAAWQAANGAESTPGTRTVAQPKLTPEEAAEIRALGYASGESGQ